MRNKTKYTLATTVIASSVLLSGCGLFGGEKTMEEIDPPQNESYTNDLETVEQEGTEEGASETNEEVATETIPRELYLIDANGFVVSQTVNLPKTESVAKQAVEYLIEGGPVSEMLPSGFRAVIPQDTEVSVNMDGHTVVVDFSKEFTNYQAEDEQKILQAITYTLTQFESIQDVEISVNGNKLEEMPVNGTPITDKLSRADGINIDNSDVTDITSTKPITVYFIAENDGNEYYVPVTKRIKTSEQDNVVNVINELIKGPGLAANLYNDIHGDVELLGSTYADGKVTLDFNEAIFGSFNDKMISTHVLNTIVLSLTEQEGVESVAITVEGEKGIVNEAGTSVSEPVTRPEKVNTGSF
ncbi:GerMN domain-containing protein [Bacillus sp. PS06]|uniref:GerMN domain-containing protein n=1 Tax=Bacillus sp. PS06 TaxID=2764176 RepID=UPI001783ED24|nr:GerMN domain-containing protein [Bacillus sp. PS06]MBD8068889.1 GerMN domain-containing protein [Bacillus sp. PS06]